MQGLWFYHEKGQLSRFLVGLSTRWRWTVAGGIAGPRSCGFRDGTCHWLNNVDL